MRTRTLLTMILLASVMASAQSARHPFTFEVPLPCTAPRQLPCRPTARPSSTPSVSEAKKVRRIQLQNWRNVYVCGNSQLLGRACKSEFHCFETQIRGSLLWKGTASAVSLSTCKMDGFSR
jgi:hypothetical protein